MKKFNLFTLYFFALGITLAQTVEDFDFVPAVTDNNMSVVFPAGTFNDFVGGSLMAFNKSDGFPVSSASPVAEDGSAPIPVIGKDAMCGCDLAIWDDEIQFAILMDGSSIFTVDINPPITYSPNGFIVVSGEINIRLLGSGCTENWADNYDPDAYIDDGSCYKIGCTDPEANNYDSLATDQDNSCVYNTPISFQLSSGWNMVGYTGTADNNGIVDQMDAALGNDAGTANTFQVIKNVSGAFWSAAFAQITEFIPGEGYMMFVNGDATTVNFQNTSGYISDIEYSLSSGWNMVAFTGDIDSEKNIVNAMDAALENGAGTANTFQVIKNVSGAFWSAAFAQITEFTPGEAYMMFVNGNPTTVNFQR